MLPLEDRDRVTAVPMLARFNLPFGSSACIWSAQETPTHGLVLCRVDLWREIPRLKPKRYGVGIETANHEGYAALTDISDPIG